MAACVGLQAVVFFLCFRINVNEEDETMMYMCKFFKTKDEAKAFQKEHGYGVMYSREKGSRTKSSYQVEAAIHGLDEKQVAETPYAVAWNE